MQFDSRFLELKGDTKIDLKHFSSEGYVEPGKYNLQVQLNKQPLAEKYESTGMLVKMTQQKLCLSDPGTGSAVWFKEDVAKNLQWSHDAKCLKFGQLEGMEIRLI
ncbi:FimD/PapC N-terminal domain-containing protein [Shigella flexneri]